MSGCGAGRRGLMGLCLLFFALGAVALILAALGVAAHVLFWKDSDQCDN